MSFPRAGSVFFWMPRFSTHHTPPSHAAPHTPPPHTTAHRHIHYTHAHTSVWRVHRARTIYARLFCAFFVMLRARCILYCGGLGVGH